MATYNWACKSEIAKVILKLREIAQYFGQVKNVMTFNELVRLLEQNGFKIIKEKGSIRYYSKPEWNNLIRVDYHGSKEVPKGTCHAILKAAGVKR